MTVVLLVIVAIVLAGLGGIGWGALWGATVIASPEEAAADPVQRGIADLERLHAAALGEIVRPASLSRGEFSSYPPTSTNHQ